MDDDGRRSRGWLWTGAFVGAVAALMIWLAMLTGPEPIGPPVMNLVNGLLSGLPFALLWLGAAVGLGWPLRRLLLRGAAADDVAAALQAGLGVAALVTLDAALGAAGLLSVGRGAVAWLLIAAGVFLLVRQLMQAHREQRFPSAADALDVTMLAAAPAVAVLLVAASSAPGWLWETEFGGYDALSYHLQLPREWFAAGRIEPGEHNVYSFLPGYAEAAYYHLHILVGDGHRFVYAAQYLHALVALLAAMIAARWLRALGVSRPLSSLGAVLVIGTPWIIVTGSLAYNEMFTVCFFAAALLLIVQSSIRGIARAACAGIFIGAACGAKLTAVGFVAAPIVLAMVWNEKRDVKAIGAALACCAIVAAITLSPWLARNAAHSGNPVFPFASMIFGRAHWEPEQVERWNAAHEIDASAGERLAAVWNQLLRFGIGEAPAEFPDRWKPQWSILFPLGLLLGVAGLVTRRHSAWCIMLLVMVAAQLVFWAFFTHLKSRFMIPAVIPLAGMCVLGIDGLIGGHARPHEVCGGGADDSSSGSASRALGIAIFISGAIYALQPMLLFARENGGRPAARLGLEFLSTGRGVDREIQAILAEQSPSAYLNTQLPVEARVLLVGDAAPLYYERFPAYATTWDQSPLSSAMKRSDDPAEWASILRADGFTHVLVNRVMLDRWSLEGWGDPNLTSERVLDLLERHGRSRAAWENGAIVLYELVR